MNDQVNKETEEKTSADDTLQEGKPEEEKEHTTEATGKINREIKEQLTEKKAIKLGMSYIDVGKQPINADVLKLVAVEDARKALIIPFYKLGEKIRVALAHPTNPETLKIVDKLKKDGYSLNYNLATEESVTEALENYKAETAKVEKKEKLKVGKTKSYEEEIKDLENLGKKMADMHSEDMLDALNVASIKTGASDIHVQPEEKEALVRFRIDGILHPITKMSPKTYEQLVNQIKYQSKLKLNISNVPQDGRYFFDIDERKIDVRVSALPTEYGETFVCRLLDSSKGIVPLDQLGFTDLNWEHLQQSVKISEGLILLTGPTGSGKTTTLYSMLNELNKPEVKIITLEDPIEYHISNISQSQINEKRGYTFSGGLRSILRQDPDIVMLGEIRDEATAQTAAQAALTGHVVLSTLHTNSAIESIPRLINMGLPPFMVAPASYMFIAQRLVRKLCENCKKEKAISDSEKQYIEETIERIKKVEKKEDIKTPQKTFFGEGCDKCSKTGFAGRISIVEILRIDDEIKELILANSSSKQIYDAVRNKGMLTLQEDGIKKVLKGITTIEEVRRVTTMREE